MAVDTERDALQAGSVPEWFLETEGKGWFLEIFRGWDGEYEVLDLSKLSNDGNVVGSYLR